MRSHPREASWLPIIFISAGAIIVTGALFGISLTVTGNRDISALENIDGIPFPRPDNAVLITEKLAHADIYLQEPVLAKNLRLTITFNPKHTKELAVGVRANSFWLSYPKVNIYNMATDRPGVQSRELLLPISTAIQDTDRSIDIMFFATTAVSTASEDEGVFDAVDWELHNLTAKTELTWPSAVEVKNYLGSIIHRERPL